MAKKYKYTLILFIPFLLVAGLYWFPKKEGTIKIVDNDINRTVITLTRPIQRMPLPTSSTGNLYTVTPYLVFEDYSTKKLYKVAFQQPITPFSFSFKEDFHSLYHQENHLLCLTDQQIQKYNLKTNAKDSIAVPFSFSRGAFFNDSLLLFQVSTKDYKNMRFCLQRLKHLDSVPALLAPPLPDLDDGGLGNDGNLLQDSEKAHIAYVSLYTSDIIIFRSDGSFYKFNAIDRRTNVRPEVNKHPHPSGYIIYSLSPNALSTQRGGYLYNDTLYMLSYVFNKKEKEYYQQQKFQMIDLYDIQKQQYLFSYQVLLQPEDTRISSMLIRDGFLYGIIDRQQLACYALN